MHARTHAARFCRSLMPALMAWAVVVFGSSAPVEAGPNDCIADQSQLSSASCITDFHPTGIAQSFTPSLPTMCGAELYVTGPVGQNAAIVIQLWDALPDAGGALLTEAADFVVDSTVSVSWCPVTVVPGAQYFLVFLTNDPDLCIAGDPANPYPDGHAYAGSGYSPLPDSDFSFQTFGTESEIDQEQTGLGLTIDGSGPAVAQQYTPSSSSSCGASVYRVLGPPTGTEITIELWDRLPDDGGHRLASGTSPSLSPLSWETVSWPAVAVDPSRPYFLVVRSLDPVTYAGSSGYTGGSAWVDLGDGNGFVELATRDLAFKTFVDPCEIDADQPVVEDCGAPFLSGELAQSFTPTSGSVSGGSLDLFPVPGAGITDITIELWDDLPGHGGTLLASGTHTGLDAAAGEDARVEWKPVRVVPGIEYFFVYGSTDSSACPAAASGNPYSGGDSYVNGVSDPDSDWAFESYTHQIDCMAGNVNQTGEVVLTVNGEHSSDGAWLQVPVDGPITASIVKPSAGGNGKFLVHARWGAPTSDTVVSLPGQIGDSCFDFLMPAAGGTADPAAIWNNIGKVDKVGASKNLDGTSVPDPSRAPTDFLSLPAGDATNLPVGTVFSLHGVIIDPNTSANKPVSLTNTVIVSIQ